MKKYPPFVRSTSACSARSINMSHIGLPRRCFGWLCLALLLAWLPSSPGFAQAITPVWEYLINKLPAPLPILTNKLGWTTDLENGDGQSLMDCIGPMRRYDAN